jgi:hypothetical protein
MAVIIGPLRCAGVQRALNGGSQRYVRVEMSAIVRRTLRNGAWPRRSRTCGRRRRFYAVLESRRVPARVGQAHPQMSRGHRSAVPSGPTR